MKAQHPRTELSTHQVINQPPLPGDFSLFEDPALALAMETALARLSLSGGLSGKHEAELPVLRENLTAFGKLVGGADMRELGRLANENKPVLKAFDAGGRRIDEVEYHPAYHQLMKTGIENGVSSRAWTDRFCGHVTHAALSYMMGWADSGVSCPMTMTYAVTPVLQAEDWTNATWLPGVTSARYDGECKPAMEKTGLTMGMAMTEKQGGSDLRANTTEAKVGADGEAELTGHKWFCSAPMSDGFLTLAQEADGLSCFLVPKWRPNGRRNAIEIQRLKDKMGDHSNASSEIEYNGAWARRVGAPGRGIATIINMVHHTRFDCITGSAAGMRKAVAMAGHFARHRTVFQKKLVDQPLMQTTLADLALESEAALALCFAVGAGFDAPRDSHASRLSRVLTPVAKYWVCKRQPPVVAEALECLGGVGFVEESGLPRLFRTSPLNSVWEGSGNVIALDIMRALRDQKTAQVFADEVARIGGENSELLAVTDWLQDASGADARLFAERAALVFAADALPAGPLRQAWITLRLQNPSHIWGANAQLVDTAHIVSRLEGWHQQV